MNERRQTLQWCPTAHDVVTLEIDGVVMGRLISGRVVECYTFKPEKCAAKRGEFCWRGCEILTVLEV